MTWVGFRSVVVGPVTTALIENLPTQPCRCDLDINFSTNLVLYRRCSHVVWNADQQMTLCSNSGAVTAYEATATMPPVHWYTSAFDSSGPRVEYGRDPSLKLCTTRAFLQAVLDTKGAHPPPYAPVRCLPTCIAYLMLHSDRWVFR